MLIIFGEFSMILFETFFPVFSFLSVTLIYTDVADLNDVSKFSEPFSSFLTTFFFLHIG